MHHAGNISFYFASLKVLELQVDHKSIAKLSLPTVERISRTKVQGLVKVQSSNLAETNRVNLSEMRPTASHKIIFMTETITFSPV